MTSEQSTGTRPLAVVLGQVDVPLQRAAEAAAQAGFTVYVPPIGADLRRDPAAQQALAVLCSQSLDQTKILAFYMQLRQRPALITTSSSGALLVSGFENSPPGPYPPAALTGMLKLHLRRRSPMLSDQEHVEAETVASPSRPTAPSAENTAVPQARSTTPADETPTPLPPRPAAPLPRPTAAPAAEPAATANFRTAPAAPRPTAPGSDAAATPSTATPPTVTPPATTPVRPVVTPTTRPVAGQAEPATATGESPGAAADSANWSAARQPAARPVQQRMTPVVERPAVEPAAPARGFDWTQITARAAIFSGAVLIIVAVFAIRGLLVSEVPAAEPTTTTDNLTAVPTAVAPTAVPTAVAGTAVQLPSATAVVARPNLQIELIAIEPAAPQVGEPVNIRLRVRNIGDTATQGPIWVDLYVNPSRTPAIGDTWDGIAANGTTWEVAMLRPGEVRELTTLEADASRSNFVAFDAAGAQQIVVQVDTFGEAYSGADQGTPLLLGPQEVTVSNGTSQP